jgi:hypothetical protein
MLSGEIFERREPRGLRPFASVSYVRPVMFGELGDEPSPPGANRGRTRFRRSRASFLPLALSLLSRRLVFLVLVGRGLRDIVFMLSLSRTRTIGRPVRACG